MTIWRIRIAFWVPKETTAHSEYYIYWFFTATVVARTALSLTLFVHCLSCYNRDGLVYCALRNESLCIFQLNLSLQSTIEDASTLTSENQQEDHSSLILANRPILIHDPQKVFMARQGVWQTVSRSFDLTDWLIVQRLERLLCDIKQQQFTWFTLQIQATD